MKHRIILLLILSIAASEFAFGQTFFRKGTSSIEFDANQKATSYQSSATNYTYDDQQGTLVVRVKLDTYFEKQGNVSLIDVLGLQGARLLEIQLNLKTAEKRGSVLLASSEVLLGGKKYLQQAKVMIVKRTKDQIVLRLVELKVPFMQPSISSESILSFSTDAQTLNVYTPKP